MVRNQDEVKRIKETYLPGMVVRLVRMDDCQAPPVGCEGIVRGVDDIGSVMISWDMEVQYDMNQMINQNAMAKHHVNVSVDMDEYRKVERSQSA